MMFLLFVCKPNALLLAKNNNPKPNNNLALKKSIIQYKMSPYTTVWPC